MYSVNSIVEAYICEVILSWSTWNSSCVFLGVAYRANTKSLVTVIPLASLGLCSTYWASERFLWSDYSILYSSMSWSDDSCFCFLIERDFVELFLCDIDSFHMMRMIRVCDYDCIFERETLHVQATRMNDESVRRCRPRVVGRLRRGWYREPALSRRTFVSWYGFEYVVLVMMMVFAYDWMVRG